MHYTCFEVWSIPAVNIYILLLCLVLQLDKLLPQQLYKSMYDDIVSNQNSFYMDS